MSRWLGLSQDERDERLLSIPYVDKPLEFKGFLGANTGGKNLLNYSQIYKSCKRCLELPHPHKLRTGDIVHDGDIRGSMVYYVIWLREGMIEHTAEFIAKFKEGLIECPENEVPIESVYSPPTQSIHTGSVPKFISRQVDGPHNDFIHDCYLSLRPDELSDCCSVALSSAPIDYYPHSDTIRMLFDPLLTHSLSFWGMKIRDEKELEGCNFNELFPDNYLGYYEQKQGEDEEMEWISLLNPDNESYRCPKYYIAELRDLFNRHFDPSAPVEVAESDAKGPAMPV